MKQAAKDSLEKIKYLMEFHFKPHGRDSVEGMPTEQPVKFNEIGEVYKSIEDDYPSFESYRNDVILSEDDPEEDATGQQPAVQPQGNAMPDPQAAPAPVPQEPAANIAPQPEPVPSATPEPAVPMPEPQPSSFPEDDNALFGKVDLQIAKTDEMLAKFDLMQRQLANMDTVSLKLGELEKKIEDLNNPPYEDQLEMISKQAYPYNIKLSDFWGWDDEKDEAPESQGFQMSVHDINNGYNKEDIKNSFNA